MTLPGGAGDVSTTQWGITGNDGTIPGQTNNTQANVTDVLKGGYTNPSGTTSWRNTANALYTGLDKSLPLPQATVQPTHNAIATGLGGLISGINYTLSQISSVFTNKADVQAQHTTQIAALQQTATQHANNGANVLVDFTTYTTNTANLPSSPSSGHPAAFAQTYVGSSATGTFGIQDGAAGWYPASDNPRETYAVYTPTQMATLYQLIGAVFTNTPGADIFGNRGYNYIFGRSNASGSTRVQVKLGADSCKLEFVTGSFASPTVTAMGAGVSGFSFKSSASYWLQCGTTGDVNTYRIWENSRVIYEFADTSGIAAAATGFYAGLGARAFASIFGTIRPANVLAFTFADNIPPAILGSGFRRYRTSTTGVSISSGNNLLPGSFFDTADIITEDFTYTSSTNSLVIGNAGWYMISLQIALSGFLSSNYAVAPQIIQNSQIAAWSNQSFGTAGSFGGSSIIAGTFLLYCDAGDVLQPGYNANTSPSSTMVGAAGGAQTFWSVALVNRSIA